jgi:cytochrome c peroxidase
MKRAASVAVVVAILGGRGSDLAVAGTNADPLRDQARALFGSIESFDRQLTPVESLGRQLFFDRGTAADGKTACVACHLPERSGADGLRFSTDARGKQTSRNAPTVFNVTGQFAQRWRADRPSAAAQAEESLTGSLGWPSPEAALAALRELGYEPAFKAAFPADVEALSPANFGRAVAAYEATLATPGPFDRFLAGKPGALSAEQRHGLELFISAGCSGCHNGPLVGGRVQQKFGVAKPYWELTHSEPVDEGRAAVTKQEADRYVFKVPPLRNVEKTAPYFHDGSVADLSRAVAIMSNVQLGRTLTPDEITAIVAFLNSLTGAVPSYFAPT